MRRGASPERNLYVMADVNAEKWERSTRVPYSAEEEAWTIVFASIFRCGTTSFLGPLNCFRSRAPQLLRLLIQYELLSLKGTTEESKLITIVCGQTNMRGESERAEFHAEGHGEVPMATPTCRVSWNRKSIKTGALWKHRLESVPRSHPAWSDEALTRSKTFNYFKSDWTLFACMFVAGFAPNPSARPHQLSIKLGSIVTN